MKGFDMENVKTENPMISVIVPVYNAERYLEKCVDSILAQTHENLEVILVDDGSTDGSAAICDGYAKKDSRIVVIHKENGGQSSARNRGLDICRGEYIGFVDSDDSIKPDMYRAMLEKLLETGSDMAVCGARLSNGDEWHSEYSGQIIDRKTLYLAYINYKSTHLVVWDKLCRREIWCGDVPLRFPEGMINEDLYIMGDLTERCEKAVFLREAYYDYLIFREGSTSGGGFSAKKLDLITAARHFCETYRENVPELYPLVALRTAKFILLVMGEIPKSFSYFKNRKEYSRLRKLFLAEYEAAVPYITDATLDRTEVEDAAGHPFRFFIKNTIIGLKRKHGRLRRKLCGENKHFK